MEIDELILINQLAQGIATPTLGDDWFQAMSIEKKRDVLRETNFLIANANPRTEDAGVAIQKSGLRPTFTPCVLLTKGTIQVQLAKFANLPEKELLKALRLLISLLGEADERRRNGMPLNAKSHWWHRDLSDPDVLAEIRNEFRN